VNSGRSLLNVGGTWALPVGEKSIDWLAGRRVNRARPSRKLLIGERCTTIELSLLPLSMHDGHTARATSGILRYHAGFYVTCDSILYGYDR
jgi:hypothetical protein